MAPWVDVAHGEDFRAFGFGAELPDAGAHETADAEGGFGVGVDVDGLIEVETAVVTAFDAVEDVVRVFGAEAAHDDLFGVGAAVAVRVLHEEEFGAVGDVGAAVGWEDAGGDEEALVEDGAFVGFAVVVGVFEDDDFVRLFLSGFDVRVDGGAGDPETAFLVPCHLDGFSDERVLGEEIDFEFRGEFEGGLFDGWVDGGDFLEIALGLSDGGEGEEGSGDPLHGGGKDGKVGVLGK